MFPRIKRLQPPQRLEKFRRHNIKETRDAPSRNCGDCKQAISLPNGVYCGVWREQIDDALCVSCPYFDPEPSGYKLFKRM